MAKECKNKAEELNDEELEDAVGGVGTQPKTKKVGSVSQSKPSIVTPATGPVTLPVQPKNPGVIR